MGISGCDDSELGVKGCQSQHSHLHYLSTSPAICLFVPDPADEGNTFPMDCMWKKMNRQCCSSQQSWLFNIFHWHVHKIQHLKLVITRASQKNIWLTTYSLITFVSHSYYKNILNVKSYFTVQNKMQGKKIIETLQHHVLKQVTCQAALPLS